MRGLYGGIELEVPEKNQQDFARNSQLFSGRAVYEN
jgi:hypothetical protein